MRTGTKPGACRLIHTDRAPDPVLQQVEDFHDGGVSAADTLRPVSRYFDRITRAITTGKVVEGDPDHPQESVEVWTFIRRPATGWSISAIQAA